jgi:phage portal protein BeeE
MPNLIIEKTTESLENDLKRQNLDSFQKDRKGLLLDPSKLFYRKAEKGLRKPTRISYETLRRMSKSCSVARLCINTLKHEISKTKWAIVPVNPKEVPDKDKVAEVEQFFNFPNPDDNFRTFLLMVLEDLLVLDAGTIELVANKKGNLAEMYYLDGATVKPAVDIHGMLGEPAYFQFMPLNTTAEPDAEFSRDELAYIMQNPQGDIKNFGYGLSPLEGVIMVATNILNADNFNGSFFEVGTLPPIMINLGKEMQQSEVEAFRAYWKAEIEGKPWKTAFVGGIDDPKILPLQPNSNRDMQFMEYQLWLSRLMTAAYEISPQDIGLTFDINKATAETQREISKAKGYRTVLEVLKEIFTQKIIWKGLGYRDLQFVWTDVDLVDAQSRASVWEIESRTGARSINEYRKEVGLDPIKGGIRPFVIAGQVPVYIDSTPLEDMNDEEVIEEANTAEENKEQKEVVATKEETKEETKDETTKEKNVEKTVQAGKYLCWMDDRGYGQPFAWTDELGNKGYYIKPPVSVNLHGPDLESKITKELAEKGLNVVLARKVPYKEVIDKCLPSSELKNEFEKYRTLSAEYYSKKWDSKWGKTRAYDFYIVSPFVKGFSLTDKRLTDDMKRDPESYSEAINDLANLWKAEKEMKLGDRRANQYLITPDKRAYGLDYQFEGGESHTWGQYADEIPNVLKGIPELQKLFLKKIGGKGNLEKSQFHKIAVDKLNDFYHNQLKEKEESLTTHLNNQLKSIYSDVIVPKIDKLSGKITKDWINEVDNDWNLKYDGWSLEETKKKKKHYSDVFKEGLGLAAFLIANSMRRPSLKDDIDKILAIKAPQMLKDLEPAFEERSLATTKSVAMTIYDSVNKYLENAKDEDYSRSKISSDIKDLMGWDDKWRADRIARTESVWASNQGVIKASKELGIDEFEILYGGEPCDICTGEFGDGSGPFNDNDISDIPLHPNCECTANPIVPEDWDINNI